MRKSRIFIKNTLILSITALFMRVLSVYFNVYLSDKLGSEGLGLFTLTLSIYGLASTLATSAINLTATRMVADASGGAKYSDVNHAMKKCIAYSLFFGVGSMALLLMLSRVISLSMLGDIRTLESVRALAFTLPFVALSSALGGYFTAVRRVSKNASSQIFQQLLKVALTVVGLSFMTPKGTKEACLTVVLASLASEVISFLYLLVFYVSDIRKNYKIYREGESENLRKKMLNIALPTAFTSYFRSALVTVEHLLITSGLKKNGMSQSDAVSAYGVMQAKALPTVLFPYAFLTPFCSLLVPEVAEKRAAGDSVGINRITETACRFVFAFGICAAGVVICYSSEIGEIIYSDVTAGQYIRLLAPIMPVMFIDTTIDSILKGLNEQLYGMKVNLIDSILSVGVVFVLVPKIGMLGYVIEIIFCEIVNTALSAARLIKLTCPRIRPIKWIFLPLATVSLSIFITKALLTVLGVGCAYNAPLLTLHITLVIFVYSFLLRLLGCYSFREIAEFFGIRKYILKRT